MGDAGTRRRWGSELDATLRSPPGTKRPQVRGILVESLWNPCGILLALSGSHHPQEVTTSSLALAEEQGWL